MVQGLAAVGQWKQAERVAAGIFDFRGRAEALAKVAYALAAAGQLEQAARVAADVERVAGTISDPRGQAEMLTRLAESYLELGASHLLTAAQHLYARVFVSQYWYTATHLMPRLSSVNLVTFADALAPRA